MLISGNPRGLVDLVVLCICVEDNKNGTFAMKTNLHVTGSALAAWRVITNSYSITVFLFLELISLLYVQ